MKLCDIDGPLGVPFSANKRIRLVDGAAGRALLESLKIGAGRGCYVLGIRAGQGYTPIYVGKATKSFAQECFTAH